VSRARNADAPVLLETFLVAAVASFLGIRAFLAVTGYPRIGGGGLHVAHMLWGGLLMLVALGILAIFLDRSAQHVAAIVAGLGFGTFIDEIGKFLTADNNYFFRPAVALVYVIFVAVFLLGRAVAARRRLSGRESLANALDLLEEHIDRPIGARDRTRIRALLDLADGGPAPADPASAADGGTGSTALASAVRQYVDRLPGVTGTGGRWEQFAARVLAAYERMARQAWFDRALVLGVVAYTAAALVGVLSLALSARTAGSIELLTVSQVGEAGSTLVGAVLVLRGIAALPGGRAGAYHWFMRGLLVWVLVTQVFVFYASQLAGIGGLAIDLAAYVSLRLAIVGEGTASRTPVPAA
jgi:hypothetical protein